MSLVLVKNDMQAAGSAVTYARRYTLQSLLSMRSLDDDAELSVGRDSYSSGAKPKGPFTPKAAAPKDNPKKEETPAPEKKQSKFNPKLPEQTKEQPSSDGGWN
jgi:hypothetical protein